MGDAREFATEGERLVGRTLEVEKRGTILHYVPGQHEGVIVAREAPDFFTGELADIARLTYVDVMGHACVVLCARKPGEDWRATWVSRSGLYTSTDATRAPDGFQLSEKMLAALADARDESATFQSEIANSGDYGGGGNRTRVSVPSESPHYQGIPDAPLG